MSRRNSSKRLRQSAPTMHAFEPANAQVGRKKMQLCRQVHEALIWTLGTATNDERLSYCTVVDVEPLPGGNRLLVKVGVPPDLWVSDIAEQLEIAAPTLRTEVAQSITRRKAPELIFVPVPA